MVVPIWLLPDHFICISVWPGATFGVTILQYFLHKLELVQELERLHTASVLHLAGVCCVKHVYKSNYH